MGILAAVTTLAFACLASLVYQPPCAALWMHVVERMVGAIRMLCAHRSTPATHFSLGHAAAIHTLRVTVFRALLSTIALIDAPECLSAVTMLIAILLPVTAHALANQDSMAMAYRASPSTHATTPTNVAGALLAILLVTASTLVIVGRGIPAI